MPSFSLSVATKELCASIRVFSSNWTNISRRQTHNTLGLYATVVGMQKNWLDNLRFRYSYIILRFRLPHKNVSRKFNCYNHTFKLESTVTEPVSWYSSQACALKDICIHFCSAICENLLTRYSESYLNLRFTFRRVNHRCRGRVHFARATENPWVFTRLTGWKTAVEK